MDLPLELGIAKKKGNVEASQRYAGVSEVQVYTGVTNVTYKGEPKEY